MSFAVDGEEVFGGGTVTFAPEATEFDISFGRLPPDSESYLPMALRYVDGTLFAKEYGLPPGKLWVSLEQDDLLPDELQELARLALLFDPLGALAAESAALVPDGDCRLVNQQPSTRYRVEVDEASLATDAPAINDLTVCVADGELPLLVEVGRLSVEYRAWEDVEPVELPDPDEVATLEEADA